MKCIIKSKNRFEIMEDATIDEIIAAIKCGDGFIKKIEVSL